jgi:hypothetical protein
MNMVPYCFHAETRRGGSLAKTRERRSSSLLLVALEKNMCVLEERQVVSGTHVMSSEEKAAVGCTARKYSIVEETCHCQTVVMAPKFKKKYQKKILSKKNIKKKITLSKGILRHET